MRITTALGEATRDVRRWARRDQLSLAEELRVLVAEALAARERGPKPYRVPADRTAEAKRMIGFRLPPELLALVDAAASNGRTRSAEILARLEDSYAIDGLPDEIVAKLDDLAQLEGVTRAALVADLLAACLEGAEAEVSASGDGALLGVSYPVGDPFDQVEAEALELGLSPVESS